MTSNSRSYPISTVLNYLIDEVTEQEKKIASLESKLEQRVIRLERHLIMSLTAPFREGKVYLEEARYSHSQEEQRQHLRAARERFITISQIDLSDYPLLPVEASFYVGVCYDLLSDDTNALRWYRKAHESIVATIGAQDPDWRTKNMRGFLNMKYRIIFMPELEKTNRNERIDLEKSWTLENWPMGELSTRHMFSFANYLTVLIASRAYGSLRR